MTMKKSLLFCTIISASAITGGAFAADCTSVSGSVTETKCKNLGYTMTASQCSGKNMVKCPLNTNWVWCGDQSSSSTNTCSVTGISPADLDGDIPSGTYYLDFSQSSMMANISPIGTNITFTPLSAACGLCPNNEEFSVGDIYISSEAFLTLKDFYFIHGSQIQLSSGKLILSANYIDFTSSVLLERNTVLELNGYTACATSGSFSFGSIFTDAPRYTDTPIIKIKNAQVSSSESAAANFCVELSSNSQFNSYSNSDLISQGSKIFSPCNNNAPSTCSLTESTLNLSSELTLNKCDIDKTGYIVCAEGGDGCTVAIEKANKALNTCSSDYSLTTCPEGGVCEECGGKYNITGCKSNWNYYSYGKYCCDANEYIYTTCPGNSDCTTCGSWYKWDSCYEGYEWRDDLSKCCPSGNASCD